MSESLESKTSEEIFDYIVNANRQLQRHKTASYKDLQKFRDKEWVSKEIAQKEIDKREKVIKVMEESWLEECNELKARLEQAQKLFQEIPNPEHEHYWFKVAKPKRIGLGFIKRFGYLRYNNEFQAWKKELEKVLGGGEE